LENSLAQLLARSVGEAVTNSSRLNVLMFSWEFPPHLAGGLARHVEGLASALADEGVEIHLITAESARMPEYERKNGVHIYRTGPLHPNETQFLKWVADLNGCMIRKAGDILAKHEIHLIHAHDWLVAGAALSCKRFFGLPLITTVHSTEYGRSGNRMSNIQRIIHEKECDLMRQSDRLIVCSTPMVKEIQQILTHHPPLSVIANGIDIKEEDREWSSSCLSGRFQWLKDKTYFFSIGRMVWEKGFQTIIEAAPMIMKSAEADIYFVVAGKGPLLERFRQQVKERGLEDNVFFVGFVSEEERLALLHHSTLTIFPSLYEPFGIAALEAMAAKKLVVSANTGGLETFIKHQQSGILFQAGSPESLTKEIVSLLKNPSVVNKLAEQGYHTAKHLYSWAQAARKTKRLYESIWNV
jgi:glycosyltransferase involved in cell wall biosynthesis